MTALGTYAIMLAIQAALLAALCRWPGVPRMAHALKRLGVWVARLADAVDVGWEAAVIHWRKSAEDSHVFTGSLCEALRVREFRREMERS